MTSRTGMPVQGPGERSIYPAHVFPLRWTEEATASSERNNRAMTGAIPPEGRRSGDVGGAGLLTNLQPNFRTRPRRRGDPSTTTRRTESSPKGRIKRVYKPNVPFRDERGRERAKQARRGMPGGTGCRQGRVCDPPSPFCVSKRGDATSAARRRGFIPTSFPRTRALQRTERPPRGAGRSGFPRCAGEMSEGQRGLAAQKPHHSPSLQITAITVQKTPSSKSPLQTITPQPQHHQFPLR